MIKGRGKIKGLRLPWGHLTSPPQCSYFWRSQGFLVGMVVVVVVVEGGCPLGVFRIYERAQGNLEAEQEVHG